MVHLLYIEDDDVDFELFADTFSSIQSQDMRLSRAISDSDALRSIFQNDVDIVFVDNHIGVCLGIDFVESMRKIGCGLPMIILTGDDDLLSDQAALRAGACNFLGKSSLSASVIERTIRYCCRSEVTPLNKTIIDENKVLNENNLVSRRILLVEDDEDDYLITKEMLTEAYGGQLLIEWVKSVDEAKIYIRENEIDVVLVDFRLGGCSGLDLVRDALKDGADCPFIVLTGDNARATDMAALEAGATDYLVKSEITPTLIDRTIRYSIERFRTEKKLAELARFDQLTGLANRFQFQEFLDHELVNCKENRRSLGLLLIDLDRFKQINDTHGHATGDALLKEVASRLLKCVRATDLVARLGGDEFVVVLVGMEGRAEVIKRAEQISHALHEPLTLLGVWVEPGASVGISVYPNDAITSQELIVSADTAMYSVKRDPPARIGEYTPEMRVSTNRRLNLERTMKFAIEASQFHLRYQPQFDLQAMRICGFEALLRWRHPEMGEISPGEFVGIAEDNGSILAIGDWVIIAACAQLARWRELNFPQIRIAVNVSARQLCDPDLPRRISEILDQHGVPPHCLEIEITENSVMANPVQSIDILSRIVDIGVGVALDDFGTGYSSLVHLRDFPGTVIKIDKKFVNSVGQNRRDSSIVEALISISHSMDLKIIAEGVENQAQLNFLKERKCDMIQGFLISKPLLVEQIGSNFFELEKLLKT